MHEIYIYIYTGILIHSYSVSVNTCWSQVKCIFGPQRLVAGSVPNPAKSWDICWEIHSLHWTKPLSQFLIVKPVESLILMVISYLLYIHTNTHTHTPIHFDVSHAGQAILQVSPRPQPAPLPAAWPSSSSSP